MGFRKLYVQKRSSEVRNILGAVETEFENFEKVLDAAPKEINQASGNIEKLVGARTRAIKLKLTTMHELAVAKAVKLIAFNETEHDDNYTNNSNDDFEEIEDKIQLIT